MAPMLTWMARSICSPHRGHMEPQIGLTLFMLVVWFILVLVTKGKGKR